MPSNIRPLSRELQEKAKNELNEIENRIPEDIQNVKNWLEMQYHLKARSDDQWLVAFLRGCKYSLEKTKRKLDLYYALKSVMPEFFNNRYPFSTTMNDILNTRSIMILPQTSATPKPTLCLVRWEVCSIENCTLIDFLRFWLMGVEIFLVEDDNLVVSGVEVIVDFAQLTLNYALQCTPTIAKKILLSVENAYPIRIKGVYIINAPPIFESLYSMGKVFLSKKLKSRIFVYSADSMKEFYKQIPKRILPKEYGGENDSINKLAGIINKKIESYEPWFCDDDKYCSNETVRPLYTRCPKDILGLEGSFRKLNID